MHSTQNHRPSFILRESSSTPGSSSDTADGILSGSTGAHRNPVRRVADLRIVPVRFGGGEIQLSASPRSDACLIGSAREESMLATFWQAYLPNSALFPKQAAGYASGGWTNVVQALYGKDRVLRFALMANCYSAISRLSGSRAMADQSLRAHGRALHELRVALDHPLKARSDSVFSALRLMIVFSVRFFFTLQPASPCAPLCC